MSGQEGVGGYVAVENRSSHQKEKSVISFPLSSEKNLWIIHKSVTTLETLKIKVRAAWCCWKDPELRLWMSSHLTLRRHLTPVLLGLLPCKIETKHLPILTMGLFPTPTRSLWKWPVNSKDCLWLLDASILGTPGELVRNAESPAPP